MEDSARKRVLFFCEGWGTGGIEAVVMNVVRSQAFKQRGYDFEIFCACDWDNSLDAGVEAAGGSRFTVLPGEKASIWSKYRTVPTAFRKYLERERFDIAHINVTNRLACLYAAIAKRAGVPAVVVHAHNSSFDEAGKYFAAKDIANAFGTVFGDSADARIACTQEASRFAFGKRPSAVIHNGVDVSRFKFDWVSRAAVREVFEIPENALLVGSVGKVEQCKNPIFQLDIFASILESEPGAYFLMLGDGSMRDEVIDHAAKLGISNRLIMVPPIDKPEWIYSALDLLLFPSLKEGFGLVALEAQCSGLPVLASNEVPRDVDATPFVAHLNLDDSPSQWAETGLKMLRGLAARGHGDYQRAINDGYGSERMAREIIAQWDNAAHVGNGGQSQRERSCQDKATKRILVAGMSNNRAGTEAVIANIIDTVGDAARFDIICSEHLSNFEHILTSGNRELVVPNKRTDPLGYYRAIKQLFEEHAREYDAVWSNLNILNNVDALRLGKEHGIPRRILHSHNSHKDGMPHQRLLSMVHRNSVDKYVTDRWACSKLAGEFMFPGKDFIVIPNAIDFERYAFDEAGRRAVREELGIAPGTFVIGNIGRLAEQKNQAFLIELLPKLLDVRPEAALVIIGEGELRDRLQGMARELGVEKRVLFAGQREDMRSCYSAFDAFAFPSLFEGMPVALIEAQANGLCCIASNRISPDAAISRSTSFLPLAEDEWVAALAGAQRIPDALDMDKAAAFDIHKQAEFLKELFS